MERAHYVGYMKLKALDRRRVVSGRVYPRKTKGHGVGVYLYPVDKEGNLLDMPRKLRTSRK